MSGDLRPLKDQLRDVEACIKTLQESGSLQREDAFKQLQRYTDAAVVEAGCPVIKKIKDGFARRAIVQAVRQVPSSQARRVAPYLISQLRDDDEHVRSDIIGVCKIMPDNTLDDNVEILVENLQDSRQAVRVDTMVLFQRLQPVSIVRAGLPLCDVMKDLQVRLFIMKAMDKIPTPDLTPYLHLAIKQLKDHEPVVRDAAVYICTKVRTEELFPHADILMSLLTHTNSYVRAEALKVIQRFPPGIVVESFIMGLLQSPSKEAQADGVKMLQRFPPELIAKNGLPSVQVVKDPNARKIIVESVGKLNVADIPAHLPLVLHQLKDKDPCVPDAVVSVLSKVPTPAMVAHADVIMELLHQRAELVPSARGIIVEIVGVLPAEAVSPNLPVLLDWLRDKDRLVRDAVVKLLAHMIEDVLDHHFKAVRRLSMDADMRPAVLSVFAAAPGMTLLEHMPLTGCTQGDMRWYLDMFSEVPECTKTLQAFVNRLVPRSKGKFLLHIAAEVGHLKCCKKLVSAGATVKCKDGNGKQPIDYAIEGSHESVVNFLNSRSNFATVRGGEGNALNEGLVEEGRITRVEWYTLPLPGIVGEMGGLHSLLALTVERQDRTVRTYVIEKAAVARSNKQIQHGVHVSYWIDVEPNIIGKALHELSGRDIENNTGSRELSIRNLHTMAVRMGPYDVANCNCHHACLELYNACAAPSCRLSTMPNETMTYWAYLFSYIGLPVTDLSTSSGSKR